MASFYENSTARYPLALKRMTIRLQLGFWLLVIDLLSDSSWVQDLVAWSYHDLPAMLGRLHRSLDPGLALRWAGFGLALGFAIGLLSSWLAQ